MPLYGDGGNVRDWCYVADDCRPSTSSSTMVLVGKIANMGPATRCGEQGSRLKLLALIGRDESAVGAVADRLGHDRRYSIATEKVEALSWRPTSWTRRWKRPVALVQDHRSW